MKANRQLVMLGLTAMLGFALAPMAGCEDDTNDAEIQIRDGEGGTTIEVDAPEDEYGQIEIDE